MEIVGNSQVISKPPNTGLHNIRLWRETAGKLGQADRQIFLTGFWREEVKKHTAAKYKSEDKTDHIL